jgi:outer membrane protein TolC
MAKRSTTLVGQPKFVPAPEFERSFDSWLWGADLSWELDVWARFRRAIESADANLNASIQEYDAILVSLIAEVVTAYVDIRTLEQRLQFARENVRTQEGSLKLADALSARKSSRISSNRSATADPSVLRSAGTC